MPKEEAVGEKWEAELEVDAALARRLIIEQFPQFADAEVHWFAEGWDNSVFLVGDDLVFRFPRRQMGAEALIAEIKVMPNLAPRLPLPAPAPLYVGQPSEAFPWRFAGHRLIEGETFCSLALDREQRAASARQLGAFLAALHAIDFDEARRLGAGPDVIKRLEILRRAAQGHHNLARAAELGMLPDVQPWSAYLHEVARRPPTPVSESGPRRMTMVHGDLYFRQMLGEKESGRLCGVIDWGDVHHGDPAIDLAVALTFLPPEAEAEFRAGYGEIDEDAWRLAHFRAIQHTSILLPYGHQTGDEPLVREALVAMGFLAERIG